MNGPDDIDSAVAIFLDDGLRSVLGGTGKVDVDWEAPGTGMPYAVVVPVSEDDEYQSAGADLNDSSIGHGEIQLSIFAGDRDLAFLAGKTAIQILKDAELTFVDGVIREIRPSSRTWVQEPLSGLDPGGSSIFHRVVNFRYAVQRYS